MLVVSGLRKDYHERWLSEDRYRSCLTADYNTYDGHLKNIAQKGQVMRHFYLRAEILNLGFR